MRLLLLILTTSLSLSTLAQKASKDKFLDKKTFWTTMTLKGKKSMETFEDEVSFRSNNMGSRRMQTDEGFIKGDYIVTEVIDMDGELIIKFQAINKNAKGFSLKWEGSVFGETIEGKAFVSKKGKLKKEYFFVGELKVRGKKRE